ncbi:MAG: M42 family peptidase [Thermaerobacter sp.]|nr:M42 family peptidase [Thermaerobacter sp.]
MGLKELCEARGTPGREELVRAMVKEALPQGVEQVSTDAVGNLYAARGLKKPGPRVLLLAHLDEVGLMVVGHTDEGYLRIRPAGGVDAAILPGKPVRVGRDGKEGTIGIAPAHLSGKDRKVPIGYEGLFVDIGMHGREAARTAAPVGEMITFDTPYTESWDGHAAIAKAFDDRVGVHLCLRALEHETDFPLHVAFTVQEEVGLRGARVAGRRIRPDVALVLEATAAGDTPETPPGVVRTRLGEGPALTVIDRSTIPDGPLMQSLVRAGELSHAPWQWRRSVGGGNDAAALWPESVRVGAMSLPCRYLHSPASLMSLDDLSAAERLLGAWLQSLREVL